MSPLEIWLLFIVSIPRSEIFLFRDSMIFPKLSLSNLLMGIESTTIHPGIWSSISFLKSSKAFKIWSGLEPCVSALAFSMDHFSDVDRGICCMGNSLLSILTYPGFVLWRGYSSVALQRRFAASTNHRKQQVTGYKSAYSIGVN